MTRLINLWQSLRSGYWLIPGLILISSLLLAYLSLWLDQALNIIDYHSLKWLIFSSLDGARVVLSTIAASTFAAATLTFSVTMLTLSMASTQFGPRLLNNFLQDPYNQLVFGSFIGTFIYCLLILRGLMIEKDNIPHISASLSIVLVIINSALFIGFIHHVTASIRVEKITNEIGEQFIANIYRMYPNQYIGADISEHEDTILETEPSFVRINTHGYLQAINLKVLQGIAEVEKKVISLLVKPGQFLLPGTIVAEIRPAEFDNAYIEAIVADCFLLGTTPSPEQDVEFQIRQLVQLAARALSPGVNDPFTAMACIDYLCSGLAILASKKFDSGYIRSKDGTLLVVKKADSFETLCEACFRIIRQMVNDNPPVIIYLLDMMRQLGSSLKRMADKHCIIEEARLLVDGARFADHLSHDLATIEHRFALLESDLSLSESFYTEDHAN
ncbi:MAG: DUF2254 domain-containing protein [Gammaproteobacteria bacterium]|nr:DUF2254 domain-containing protein [Gammaproteobacteria bacterium]